MIRDERSDCWDRLIAMLAPFHGAALGTARRLAGSADEGDDLFQETILRVHSRLDSLRDEARFRSWFFAVLLSVHRSRARRSFWRRFLSLSDVPGQEPVANPPHGDADWIGARRARIALAQLSSVQREAIVLHDIQGFSVDEVATMQDVSASAVKSRLSRGRDRLRRFYLRRGWVEGAQGVAVKRSATGAPLLATSTGASPSGEEV